MTITKIYATSPIDLTTLPAADLRSGLNAVRPIEAQVPGITKKYSDALAYKYAYERALAGWDGRDA